MLQNFTVTFTLPARPDRHRRQASKHCMTYYADALTPETIEQIEHHVKTIFKHAQVITIRPKNTEAED